MSYKQAWAVTTLYRKTYLPENMRPRPVTTTSDSSVPTEQDPQPASFPCFFMTVTLGTYEDYHYAYLRLLKR